MSILKKLMIALVIGVLVMALAGYLVIFHTSLPAKAIVGLINQSPNVNIKGIEGSFSSGFSVETIRITDKQGNNNTLDDIKLHYESGDESLTITEFHVGNGHFFVDFNNINSNSNEFEEDSSDEFGDETSSSTSSESGGMNFNIQKLSINNVTLEDVNTGEKFTLEGLQIEDLKLGDSADLGKLLVESSSCNVKVLPIKDSTKAYSIDATLKPDFHENIIKNIKFSGQTSVDKNDETSINFTSFDGKVKMTGKNLKINKLNLSDYFKDAPPLKDFTLDVNVKNNIGIAKGNFLIGDKLFSIDQKVENLSEASKENDSLKAIYEGDEGRFKITIPPQMKNSLFPKMALETSADLTIKDALSTLLYSKKAEDLIQQEKQILNKSLKYFQWKKVTE